MKKQQILFINGGASKDNYKNYEEYLEQLEYKPFKIKKRWKYTFAEDLGKSFEVYNPQMPNKDFADYNEWKIIFEKTFKYLKGEIILLGHSLGATFLLKYLNENIFPIKIKKIFLISGAFKDSNIEVLGNFNFNKKLKNIKKYEKEIIFFHSIDDFVVPFSDLEDFRKIFLNSQYYIFKNKGHFIDETFFELLDKIKEIK